MPKFTYLAHNGIVTANPDKMLRFYKQQLGFKEVSRVIITQKIMKQIFSFPYECEMIKLRQGDSYLELFCAKEKYVTKKNTNTLGYNHWGYFVEDKHKFCRKLEKRGISFIKVKRDKGMAYFIKDPDSNRIEIMER
ncbi:MAG: VOC family protein [Candidatus Omnitrophota bacterium]